MIPIRDTEDGHVLEAAIAVVWADLNIDAVRRSQSSGSRAIVGRFDASAVLDRSVNLNDILADLNSRLRNLIIGASLNGRGTALPTKHKLI